MANIKGTAAESLILRRLMKMAAKLGHPSVKILKGALVDGERLVTTDGFRLTAIPTPKPLERYQGETLDLSALRAGDFGIVAKYAEGRYPDSAGIVKSVRKAPVLARTVVNARFLKELGELAGDQPVEITIRGHDDEDREGRQFRPRTPVEITSINAGAEPRVFSLIMPMQTTSRDKYDPYDPYPEPEIKEKTDEEPDS